MCRVVHCKVLGLSALVIAAELFKNVYVVGKRRPTALAPSYQVVSSAWLIVVGALKAEL